MWSPTLPPWEVALRATIIFAIVQILLRFAGRKELGRYALPDVALLVLVAQAVRQSIVGDDKSIPTAALALATLVFWSRAVTAAAARWHWVAKIVVGHPLQLVRDGEILDDTLKAVRLTREELLSNLRSKGAADVTKVRAAFLEPDGRVTFLFHVE